MKGCDHDVVFSGQINLSQKFAYICCKCGECGWDSRYVLARVNLDEYLRQRVIHGWASPNPPPIEYLRVEPAPSGRPWLFALTLFALLFTVCAVGLVPWGDLGPLMPLWCSCAGMGLALLLGTLCYLGWRHEVDNG